MDKELILRMKAQMQPSENKVDDLMKEVSVILEKKKKTPVRLHRGFAFAMTAIVLLCAFSFSPVGKVIAKQLKAWMMPKTVTENIEGSSEQNKMQPEGNVSLADDESGYVIYVNEDIFQSEQKDGVQVIKARLDAAAKMTISYVDAISVKECMEAQLKEQKIETYETAEALELQQDNMGIRYSTGDSWNDSVLRIYCIDNQGKGCYVIRYVNSVEAEEGYGTRFQNMLNTFEIIKADKKIEEGKCK